MPSVTQHGSPPREPFVPETRAERQRATIVAMPTVGQPPSFRGRAVIVEFAAEIANARIIHAGLSGLVRDLDESAATLDDLLEELPEFVARYGNLDAVLIGVARDRIEFSVAPPR